MSEGRVRCICLALHSVANTYENVVMIPFSLSLEVIGLFYFIGPVRKNKAFEGEQSSICANLDGWDKIEYYSGAEMV